jgi:hypothetical protein
MHQSICLMKLLIDLFEAVHIVKTNHISAELSDVYVVCLNFSGVDQQLQEKLQKEGGDMSKALVSQETLEPEFLDQISTCNDYFDLFRIQAIEYDLGLYNKLMLSIHQKK